MGSKQLYILLEGNDDERFFQAVVKPGLEKHYQSVQLYRYAAQSTKKIDAFLKSITAMKADYIVVADIDHSPCITHKKKVMVKKKIKSRYMEWDRVLVVVKEIESWYLAGLESEARKGLGIPPRQPQMTDTLTKEEFGRLIPKKFDSRIDFMKELLKYFDIGTAGKNNKSFGYFIKKYNM